MRRKEDGRKYERKDTIYQKRIKRDNVYREEEQEERNIWRETDKERICNNILSIFRIIQKDVHFPVHNKSRTSQYIRTYSTVSSNCWVNTTLSRLIDLDESTQLLALCVWSFSLINHLQSFLAQKTTSVLSRSSFLH